MKMNDKKSGQVAEELEDPLEAFVYRRNQSDKRLQSGTENNQPACDDNVTSEAQSHLLEIPECWATENCSGIKRSVFTKFVHWLFGRDKA